MGTYSFKGKTVLFRLLKIYGPINLPKFIFLSIIAIIPVLTWQCESNQKFYRPNLPEKLCSFGIIDVDDTTIYTPGPYALNLRTSARFISFEKSFQAEYTEEINDSLREFSFSISSSDKELFEFRSDAAIKNLKGIAIPPNIEFRSGEKYYLRATEKSTSEISAEITVPKPPQGLSFISVNRETTTLSEPLNCIGTATVKTAVIDFSFENNNNQKSYYAILVEGKGFSMSSAFFGGDPYLLEFTVRGCNYPGFLAIIQDLELYRKVCEDKHTTYIKYPVYAYFIDGSKSLDNKCVIKISTQFNDGRSFFDNIKSFKIKLLSIPEELYLFEKSLYTYGKVNDDPFSEPVYLNGNIKGGNGVFAICRSMDLNIKLPFMY